MKSLLVIGECMMEMRRQTGGGLQSSFAGDVYNLAVYAKRSFPSLKAGIFSAIGYDSLSESMMHAWQTEGLDASAVRRVKGALPGLYLANIDGHGERSFLYWRKNSAACSMLKNADISAIVEQLAEYRCVFFSGISLGILSVSDRQRLLDLVLAFKSRGAMIAFDPNYRPALWESRDCAQKWIEQAYSLADIAMPGMEDHWVLYDHCDLKEVEQYLDGLGVDEYVIKAGLEGTFVYQQGICVDHQAFDSAPVQVDSTAAGDSFGGTYLAARLNDCSTGEALRQATSIAKFVVQRPGAIVPKHEYMQYVASEKTLA